MSADSDGIIPKDRKMNIEEIYEIMKEKGQRITRQKRIVLDVFIENNNRMLTVNQIQDMLPSEEKINNATIYRNVQSFLDLGILESMIDDNGAAKYVIRCKKEHHHHLICLECGRMISIFCDRDKFNEVTEKYEFEETYHTLEVYGRCKQCVKKEK